MKKCQFVRKKKYLWTLLLITFLMSCAPMTPLTKAIKDGDVLSLKKLLYNGTNINELDSKQGWTPLYWAIYYDKADVVQLLLNAGASVNIKDADGNSPLTFAISNGNLQIFKALLDKGADINTRNKQRETPIYAAINYDQPDILQILLNNGAAINTQDVNGNSPLMTATSAGNAKILRILIERGAKDINVKNQRHENPLLFAIRTSDEDLVKLLICKGADVELQDANGYNAITVAEYNKDMNIVELIYKAKYSKRRKETDSISQMCSQNTIQEKLETVKLPPKLYKYAINYHHIRPLLNYNGHRSIAVVVQDRRPYIVSRYNGPEFVGQARDSIWMGVMSYFSTSTGKPLSDEISYCITETLKWHGFKAVTIPVQPQDTSFRIKEKIKEANVDRSIIVEITEWMSDIPGLNRDVYTYSFSSFIYDVVLSVFDDKDQQIALTHARGEDILGGGKVPYFNMYQKTQESTEKLLHKLLTSSDVITALQ